jgi:hypothetical protein
MPAIQRAYHLVVRMNLSITMRAIGSEKMETSIACRVDAIATSFQQEKKGFS